MLTSLRCLRSQPSLPSKNFKNANEVLRVEPKLNSLTLLRPNNTVYQPPLTIQKKNFHSSCVKKGLEGYKKKVGSRKEVNTSFIESFSRGDLVKVTEKIATDIFKYARSEEGVSVLTEAIKHKLPEQIEVMMEHLPGKIIEMSRDPWAHQVLVGLIQYFPSNCRFILEEMFPGFVSHMQHPYSSTVCQLLYRVCKPREITEILLGVLQSNFVRIVSSQHGSIAFCTLIKNYVTTSSQIEALINGIIAKIPPLSRNPHAHFVIIETLDSLLEEDNRPLVDALVQKSVYLATSDDLNDFFVFLKMLEHCSDSQFDRLVGQLYPSIKSISTSLRGSPCLEKVLERATSLSKVRAIQEKILPSLKEICRDANGNFLVGVMVRKYPQFYWNFMFAYLSDDLLELSKDPYGCFVIKELVLSGNEEQYAKIVNLVANPKTLHSMAFNIYSDRVLAAILSRANPQLLECIKTMVKGKVLKYVNEDFLRSFVLTFTKSPEGRGIILDEYLQNPKFVELAMDPKSSMVLAECVQGDISEIHKMKITLQVLKNDGYVRELGNTHWKTLSSQFLPKYNESEFDK